MDEVRKALNKHSYDVSHAGGTTIYSITESDVESIFASLQSELEAVKLERDELAAYVNELRECVACSLFDIDPDGAQHLGFIVDVEPPYDRSELYELLSKTPQQSLEAHDRKVRRECAELILSMRKIGEATAYKAALSDGAEAIEETIEPEE